LTVATRRTTFLASTCVQRFQTALSDLPTAEHRSVRDDLDAARKAMLTTVDEVLSKMNAELAS
jgi:hypothetical protein